MLLSDITCPFAAPFTACTPLPTVCAAAGAGALALRLRLLRVVPASSVLLIDVPLLLAVLLPPRCDAEDAETERPTTASARSRRDTVLRASARPGPNSVSAPMPARSPCLVASCSTTSTAMSRMTDALAVEPEMVASASLSSRTCSEGEVARRSRRVMSGVSRSDAGTPMSPAMSSVREARYTSSFLLRGGASSSSALSALTRPRPGRKMGGGGGGGSRAPTNGRRGASVGSSAYARLSLSRSSRSHPVVS
mmetsp:Transcript_17323/g.43504  ORF Transcript_17323/g.43504 Transcript_17323/m.43504 type:complete len:251 (+) Transcript_17323:595-1347(+)